IADAKGHLLYFSPKAQKLSGLGITDAPPDVWSEQYGMFYPDMRTRCPSEKLPLYRALHGEETPEEELFIRNPQVPEGLHVHASARPVRDKQGTLQGAIVSMRDIHCQRQAEAERHRTEQRFRLIVEVAREGIWTINTENRTTYVNR